VKWYLNHNGQQVGPLDDTAARSFAQQNPGAYAWREGFKEWVPVSQVPELNDPAVPPGPPPMPRGNKSDEID